LPQPTTATPAPQVQDLPEADPLKPEFRTTL